MPPRFEEIAYDMSRAALADQEALVNGIRSRTATLVAAQALVASFLGDAATGGGALGLWSWAAVGALLLGLLLATVIVAPWDATFSVDMRDVHRDLRQVAAKEAETETLHWLETVCLLYQEQYLRNQKFSHRLIRLFAALAVVTTVQSLLWIIAIGVR
jgi:hypothetical protein